MTPFLRTTASGLCLAAFFALPSHADETSPARARDTLTMQSLQVVGAEARLRQIAGSAHIVDRKTLDKQDYTDIHRVLREIPGVDVMEEEGFGNRPNIGIRGAGIERSGKVTVMEDGILVAPAPYSAPAAYYFPAVGRMHSVEVRKGSSQVLYGPGTTGGVLNFVSTPIPVGSAARLNLTLGEHQSGKFHGYAGGSGEVFGWLAETYQQRTDGFKELPGSAQRFPDLIKAAPTGFDRQDYLFKVRLNTPAQWSIYQEAEIKAGRTGEVSHETYLGLTEADFWANPLRRYAGSAEDRLDVEQHQLSFRHFIQPLSWLDITTRVYRNDVQRNWYKLDKVAGIGIATVLNNPSANANAYNIVSGQADSDPGALEVKANNRNYYAWGAQTGVQAKATTGMLDHTLQVGVRYHYDEEGRLQWSDRYQMVNGSLSLTQRGAPGSGSGNNRIGSTHALALYLQDDIKWSDFTLSPGVRYEHLDSERRDWAATDPERDGDPTTRESSTEVFVWGLGLSYAPTAALTVFTGVHKGFDPPGPGQNDSILAEESLNIELGARLRAGAANVQAAVFANLYDNLSGSESAAGGGLSTGEQHNGGEARIFGVELAAGHDIGALMNLPVGIPVRAAYTYMQGEFLTTFNSDYALWGNVNEGDNLPQLAEHRVLVGGGLNVGALSLDAVGNYVGPMRNTAGSGTIDPSDRIGNYGTVDVGAAWRLSRNASLTGNVKNILDEQGVASRVPSGLRPILPRTFFGGIRVDL